MTAPVRGAAELLRQAEQCFRGKDHAGAEQLLARLRRDVPGEASILHLSALVARAAGRTEEAETYFKQALLVVPRDVQIITNYANLLSALGRSEDALAAYATAIGQDPNFASARVNRAILLQRLERHQQALADLTVAERQGFDLARVATMQGASLLAQGDLDAAAEAFNRALQRAPGRPNALLGRAKAALRRGEEDAIERLRHAATATGSRDARLLLAEALAAEGDPGGKDLLLADIERDSDWIEGQRTLAQIRWEEGDTENFTAAIKARLQDVPGNTELWLALIQTLATADRHAEAAEAAARGRDAAGDDPRLLLAEAIQRSEAGETDRAGARFASLPGNIPGAEIAEARHRLRVGELERAGHLVTTVLASDPWSVRAWALQSILWRLAGDPQEEWLHGQPGLFARRSLALDDGALRETAEALRRLHRTRAHPLGQSLRGGTQTRGRLFERADPVIRRLRHAVEEAVTRHWEALPPRDATHPLLRHRDRRPRLEGSWSVRLTGGGFHVAHIHPTGVLSSACYFVIPEQLQDGEGTLELGRPPPELGTALGPTAFFPPEVGSLVLFPSTMFHGTRPFPGGERLTAAFDVAAG